MYNKLNPHKEEEGVSWSLSKLTHLTFHLTTAPLPSSQHDPIETHKGTNVCDVDWKINVLTLDELNESGRSVSLKTSQTYICPLVAGCITGHKLLSLHVSRWDTSHIKYKKIYLCSIVSFSFKLLIYAK